MSGIMDSHTEAIGYRKYNSNEKKETEQELFRSYIDSVNNAIGNRAQYDLFDIEDKDNFVENFLEELIFCLHNDEYFHIALLDIPDEFEIIRKGDMAFCSIKKMNGLCPISEQNKKEAFKIRKNPNNGCACIYEFRPSEEAEPLFMINFAYSEKAEDKEIKLYKKVINDFIELKEIDSLEGFRKVVIACFKNYKKRNENKT